MPHLFRHLAPPAMLGIYLLLTGCTSLAEDVSKHLLANDLKALQHDHCVYQNDLALYRGCFEARGGSCEGSSTTALPHSTQNAMGTPVQPLRPGSSTILRQSIDSLPPGHPARTAYRVLTHSVTQKAADLHSHLRGLDSDHQKAKPTKAKADTGRGPACGKKPTHGTHLKIHEVEKFHDGLLASIGQTAWQSLVHHCRQLLATHQGSTDLPQLKADCRSAEFIRGYIGAYLRDGEFIEVDFSLSDEVARLNRHASGISAELRTIQGQITPILAQLPPQASGALSASDAAQVAYETAFVVSAVSAQTHRGYQILVAQDFLQLEQSYRRLAAAANALLMANSADHATQLATALNELDASLTNLQSGIYSEDGRLDQAIDHAVDRLNQRLSNVIKVRSAGFVSRDLTFGARLPTLELTIDPDFGHFKTVLTDVDASTYGGTTTDGTTYGTSTTDGTYGSYGDSTYGGSTVGDSTYGDSILDDGTGGFSSGLTTDGTSDLTSGDGMPSPGIPGSGRILTRHSNLSNLGIVTRNTSGVITGGSIGAELARVFLEALFDAHEALPALSQPGAKATGLTLTEPYRLPIFQNPTGNVSAKDLQDMTHVNNAVALETQLLIGRLISGIGPFSLNNQPLEDLITEIIATSVRKGTEKATWCWYACNLDQDLARLRHDAGKALDDAATREEKDLKQKLEHWLHKEAEYVKVRFRVSP